MLEIVLTGGGNIISVTANLLSLVPKLMLLSLLKSPV